MAEKIRHISEEYEIVRSRLWVILFFSYFTITGAKDFLNILTGKNISTSDSFIEFFGYILMLLTTISFFSFRIKFDPAGQHWDLFPLVHRRYIWKGEGKKIKLLPVDYYIGIDIMIHGNIVLPGLNALFFKNIKGACRMLYLYDPNMYEEERQILRKWGKIDETEEEYYQRMIAQREANSKKRKRKLRKQKEQEERNS